MFATKATASKHALRSKTTAWVERSILFRGKSCYEVKTPIRGYTEDNVHKSRAEKERKRTLGNNTPLHRSLHKV